MPRPPLNEKDVLIEFHPVGNIVRVSAIDPATNTEIIIQGPASAGKTVLARNALAKLNYVLRKGQS
ncbi:DUF6898 family protein [Niveispirillum cyanobacteriorum]|uniref:DUF6898 domain-containing protein n=1 Tax=Niveispirillum cyanobacteriorum TaxID=1612173 RepID=A0A2K9NJT4_9PROT|nr:hypothetical protein [Niveispirillum cyanobacteriorum]AUN33347.1 hypothetical protein C0V82_23555 [Niveispirillum cyanobacteriorum]GGE49485.1 hypothetical protein GCM10011317_04810 [Niveispirillum cyanobacteriorum]